MKYNKKWNLLACVCTGLMLYAPASSAVSIGDVAPAIVATDTQGNKVDLHAIKGMTVLEWSNPECPFVKKHYDSHNMQALQKKAKADGVTWIVINSSAQGKQGNMNLEQANAVMKTQDASPTHLILDAQGTIGKAYDAKTTPHMFVIDAEHKIAYMGAIDSKNGVNSEEIKTSTNYVQAALDALKAGKQPEPSATQPYGCGVKY
jgi:alkyl hydroperoxide reductase subunit AhpC